ncbi:nitroreductase [Chachezhania sediminis]|uniref:nitroreductase n=1 Tax=Chachezhania sediminis TaxID=2599291 RepID=UPI00131DDE16|nr:nitroreductase [Chachezhania sediminis]
MTTDTLTLDKTFERLLQERYSCRGFLSDPVPRATVDRILTLAQRTASWCNTQPWHVTILGGRAAQRFSKGITDWAAGGAAVVSDLPFPEAYEGKYLDRRRESGFRLYDSVGIPKGDRAASAKQALENFRLFGAPHVAIVTTDRKLGTYGAIDCGAYVSNFILAATALGLASIPQAAFAHHADFVRDHLNLPDDRLVVCGISFGFEDKTHPANGFRTRRAGIDEVAEFIDD